MLYTFKAFSKYHRWRLTKYCGLIMFDEESFMSHVRHMKVERLIIIHD